MTSVTVGFSIPEDEQERLDRLVQHFALGNRSAFLRIAIRHMEVLQRAEILRDLQQFGVGKRTRDGLDGVAVEDIVHRVLS